MAIRIADAQRAPPIRTSHVLSSRETAMTKKMPAMKPMWMKSGKYAIDAAAERPKITSVNDRGAAARSRPHRCPARTISKASTNGLYFSSSGKV